MRTPLVARLGTVVVAGLLLAACGSLGSGSGGGSADDYGSVDSGNANDAAGSGGADAGADAGGGYGGGEDAGKDGGTTGTLQVADSDFGKILTDADGRTLYAFTMDTDGRSNCYADCADAWPPLMSEGAPPSASGEVDESLLKTVSREDGTKQVVYKSWPLYYFASDSGPGDTEGQGVNGAWWLVSPDGKLIKSR